MAEHQEVVQQRQPTARHRALLDGNRATMAEYLVAENRVLHERLGGLLNYYYRHAA